MHVHAHFSLYINDDDDDGDDMKEDADDE